MWVGLRRCFSRSSLPSRCRQLLRAVPVRSIGNDPGISLLLWTLRITVRHDRAEALLILTRCDERADHSVLNCDIANRESIDLTQPKIKASCIGIAPEVTKVFRQHKRRAVFAID